MFPPPSPNQFIAFSASNNLHSITESILLREQIHQIIYILVDSVERTNPYDLKTSNGFPRRSSYRLLLLLVLRFPLASKFSGMWRGLLICRQVVVLHQLPFRLLTISHLHLLIVTMTTTQDNAVAASKCRECDRHLDSRSPLPYASSRSTTAIQISIDTEKLLPVVLDDGFLEFLMNFGFCAIFASHFGLTIYIAVMYQEEELYDAVTSSGEIGTDNIMLADNGVFGSVCSLRF
ncbi:unnamed protein product [Lactuca saligna]|uniref:Uncharacterized protein n=1 Tax=Lactuca saligna TaxID=75948 RepID=A0AA35YJD8_LACSI|nr:unnamed protein product [Lactuca saligna]